MVELVLLTGTHEGQPFEGYDSQNLEDWFNERGDLETFRTWFNVNSVEGLNQVTEADGGFVVLKADVDNYLAQA